MENMTEKMTPQVVLIGTKTGSRKGLAFRGVTQDSSMVPRERCCRKGEETSKTTQLSHYLS